MKHFASGGLWFPADDSSTALGGTLHYDSEALSLELLGSFREGWAMEAERYPTIRGVVGENPYGTFVTLFDCLRTRSHFNLTGVTSETIRCGKATIGSTHLPDEPFHFDSLDVFLSHLTDWVGRSGLTIDLLDGSRYSINYSAPVALDFPFGAQILTVAPRHRAARGMHRVSVDEEFVIRIAPIGELAPTELGGDCVRSLQNLITFATDTPNEIEDVTYLAPEGAHGICPEYHLVFAPIFRIKKAKEPLHTTDMLFTFADAQEHCPNIFQSWLDFTARNASFCTVYFANLYAEPQYINDRFANLMLAFTLLAASICDMSERATYFLSDVETALKARFDSDERELLRHCIPTGPELEMCDYLLRLLHENAGTLGRLIEDAPAFVRSVSQSLAFFKRRPDGKRAPIEGADLLYTMLKIRTLIKVLVLKELGFDEDARSSLIKRNTRVKYLGTV